MDIKRDFHDRLLGLRQLVQLSRRSVGVSGETHLCL